MDGLHRAVKAAFKECLCPHFHTPHTPPPETRNTVLVCLPRCPLAFLYIRGSSHVLLYHTVRPAGARSTTDGPTPPLAFLAAPPYSGGASALHPAGVWYYAHNLNSFNERVPTLLLKNMMRGIRNIQALVFMHSCIITNDDVRLSL